jgi:hypothetical protein
MLGQEALQHRA